MDSVLDRFAKMFKHTQSHESIRDCPSVSAYKKSNLRVSLLYWLFIRLTLKRTRGINAVIPYISGSNSGEIEIEYTVSIMVNDTDSVASLIGM